MMKMFKLSAMVMSVAALSACGGSESEIASLTDAQRLQNYTNSFQQTLNSVSSKPFSNTNTMNNASGRASFSGEGGVFVNPVRYGSSGNVAYADATLIGQANINVNFDNNTLGGSVTNLVGADRSDRIDAYTGTITINNGFIGTTTANSITANYSGTLNGNGDRIVLGGGMDGYFVGNGTVSGVGLLGDGSGTFNGRGGTSELIVLADR